MTQVKNSDDEVIYLAVSRTTGLLCQTCNQLVYSQRRASAEQRWLNIIVACEIIGKPTFLFFLFFTGRRDILIRVMAGLNFCTRDVCAIVEL